MPTKRSLIVLVAALVVISGILAAVTPASAADREKVLYAFNGGGEGLSPSAVIFDAARNLYGTTTSGGNYQCDRYFGCGTVFKLELGAQGKWNKTILHTFKGKDGAYPSGLIFGSAGNLFGTTVAGGAKGYGTVFKLALSADGNWTETVLHSFNNKDGGLPGSTLIFDATGGLYGTTQTGGTHNFGTVFKLTPSTDARWTETVLHSFNGKDGNDPTCPLVFDSAGNLYGTTMSGGAKGFGTVFKVAPGANGSWTEMVLHSFNGEDGDQPFGGLILDRTGNLYGTTVEGGNLNSDTCLDVGCGVVFKLARDANGKWTETVLHEFSGWADGFYPEAGLIFDADGNLYSTTSSGSNVFKLSPGKDGKWTETVLRAFNGKDGWFPWAGLIFDGSGNLYGTTALGGKLNNCQNQYGNGCGVVFEITP